MAKEINYGEDAKRKLQAGVDKLANTASVYGAFLKELKKTAKNNLILKPANLIINNQDHQVFNADISPSAPIITFSTGCPFTSLSEKPSINSAALLISAILKSG